jgi:hypothetical protein
MEKSFPSHRHRTLISSGILLVLGLHIVPIVYRPERATLWPILHWAMYKDSKPPGPITTYIRKVFAISVSGSREVVDPHLTGLSQFSLAKLYLRPMIKGDRVAAANLLAKLNEHRKDDPFVELRMESAQYTVTDTGIVKQDHPLITYRAEHSDSHRGNQP